MADGTTALADGLSSFAVAVPFSSALVSGPGPSGVGHTYTVPFTFTLTTFGGCETSGASDCEVSVDFFDTALVTGYALEDSMGNTLDAPVTFGSGTNYDAIPPDAPAAAPEPSSLMLLATGFAGAGCLARRRIRDAESERPLDTA